ncbi:rhodopsin, GQ-coupled-like [Oculina patagonica]
MSNATLAVELTALAIICLVAFITNGSLFWIVLRKKDLRTMLNFFVLNLAAADLLVSFASMPVSIITVASKTWIFGNAACVLFGFVTIVSFISSVSSLGLIAINRYFYIVKWQTYDRTFSTAKGSLCAILVWVFSIALASPPLFGWAGYRYIPSKSYCFVYWQSDVYYMYFMIATCFFGPLTVMALSYYKILSFTRKHKRELATFRNRNNSKDTDFASSSQGSLTRLRISAEETKITHTLVIVVACFVFCWAPFAVTMFFDVYYPHPLPRGVHFGSLLLGYANSMFNPIFYGVRNAGFRKGFKELYSKCLPCLKSKRTAPE